MQGVDGQPSEACKVRLWPAAGASEPAIRPAEGEICMQVAATATVVVVAAATPGHIAAGVGHASGAGVVATASSVNKGSA